MGTVGDEPDWCDRRTSRNHTAVAINANMSLMFQTVIAELGLEKHDFKREAPVSVQGSAASIVKYFHVADAASSTAIPDKEQFVHPYGIQSVIGLGSSFMSKSFFVALFFSKMLISDQQANIFAEQAGFLSTLLATYDLPDQLWNQE